MLTAIQSDSRRNAELISGMQDSVSAGVARSMTPVNALGNRVDSVGEDVRSLKDALADITARMERMDAKITDLKNQMQVMQSPPPAPSASGIMVPVPSSSSGSVSSPRVGTHPPVPNAGVKRSHSGPKSAGGHVSGSKLRRGHARPANRKKRPRV